MNSCSRIMTLLRKERGLTQKQAAKDLGISQALLSHYEKGIRECGLDFLVKLCDYYNVSSDFILGRSPQRDGSVISINDLDGAESTSDSHYHGSVLPAFNKRLISSSLNVVYDMLTKANHKDLTNSVSEYLMLAVYRCFRKLYRAEKKNSQKMFTVPADVFEGYVIAQMERLSSQINVLLKNKTVVKNMGTSFELTTESLQIEFPKHAAGLLNTIKTAEDAINKKS